MRFENIAIGKLVGAGQPLERFANALDERAVLKMPNDFGVFFPEHIAKVAARFEIVERVESHDLASRKYRT
jgi:hypothetical protein